MGFAISAVVFLLVLVWLLLLRRPAGGAVEESDSEADTVVVPTLPGSISDIPFALGEEDDAGAISSIIIATLAAQKAFVSVDTGELPDKARDNFSIGYVGGYVNAVLRYRRLSDDDSQDTVGQMVFSAIFGNGDGSRLYKKYQRLKGENDREVVAGISAGESDIETWVKNNLNVPFGWSVYVHDCPGTA